MAIAHEGQLLTQPSRKRRSNKRADTIYVTLLVLGTTLFAWGAFLQDAPDGVVVGEELPSLDSQAVVSEDYAEPDETKPDVNVQTYEVAPHLPRRIIMPTLDVNSFVQQVGVTPENSIAAPGNIHVAGWFTKSALPGQTGVSIIDGHVSGTHEDGIFRQLAYLSNGSRFEIEFGDRSKKTFEVVDVQTLAVSESMRLIMQDDPAIDAQLNLVTCGGEFDQKTQSYADRLVVISRLVP